jgi:hypothetical protein
MTIKNKKGQEEMVGFVVIIIIVAVVLLVLLSFLLKSPDKNAVESYEVESFIQAVLQYTSDCENQIEFLSVQDLIVSCARGERCLDERESCEILNETLQKVIDEAWNVNEQSAVKGYKFSVKIEGEEILLFKEGNETRNYKGAFQDFAKRGSDYEISMNVYYA